MLLTSRLVRGPIPFSEGPSGDRTPRVTSLAGTLGAAAAWSETIQKVKLYMCFSLVKVVFAALIDN